MFGCWLQYWLLVMLVRLLLVVGYLAKGRAYGTVGTSILLRGVGHPHKKS